MGRIYRYAFSSARRVERLALLTAGVASVHGQLLFIFFGRNARLELQTLETAIYALEAFPPIKRACVFCYVRSARLDLQTLETALRLRLARPLNGRLFSV